MKWLVVVLGVLAAAAVIVVAIGAMLPEQHRVSRTAHFRAAPDVVWRAITDVNAFPAWRDIKRVEILKPRDGHRVWREFDRYGKAMDLEAEEETAPARMVTRIAGHNLPFGGTWTYTLTPAADGGTDLTITENGEIYNPVFRFVARFVIGYQGTIDAYLAALVRKLASV